MAKSERSFWSSIPGLLTGLAGVLTAVVGLLTLAYNLGWVGDGPAGDEPTGAATPTFRVEPKKLELVPVVQASKSVSVTNEGTEPITVSTEITGADQDAFADDDSACAGELTPGRSCQVEVTLEAGPGRHQATLVVSVDDRARSAEVELSTPV